MNEQSASAVLAGSLGAFRFSVLRYEFDQPDGRFDWLVARLGWEGKSVTVDHIGPLITAGELRDWADELGRVVSELSKQARRFAFIEPNLVMASALSSPRGHFGISLEIHGEPAKIAEHFSVEFEVDQGELGGFAAALRAWSDRFPDRGASDGPA